MNPIIPQKVTSIVYNPFIDSFRCMKWSNGQCQRADSITTVMLMRISWCEEEEKKELSATTNEDMIKCNRENNALGTKSNLKSRTRLAGGLPEIRDKCLEISLSRRTLKAIIVTEEPNDVRSTGSS